MKLTSRIWVVTDTHFFHKGIVRRDVRPPDHNERTAEALSKLGPDDILIHLGDFAFAKYSEAAEIMNRCPARSKILLLGNHDNQSYSYYTRHGFTAAMETMTLEYGGQNILFSHRPMYAPASIPPSWIPADEWECKWGSPELPDGIDLTSTATCIFAIIVTKSQHGKMRKMKAGSCSRMRQWATGLFCSTIY